VQVESVDHAVPVEFNLEFELLLRGQLVAHRANRTASRATEHTVGFPQGQPAASDNVACLMSEFQLVRHMRDATAALLGALR
jgi:hypothetical protein